MEISAAAVTRWQKQYFEELNAITPQDKTAFTSAQQHVQKFKKQLWRITREIMKS